MSCLAPSSSTKQIGIRAGWREEGGGFNFGELNIDGGGLRISRYQEAAITRDSGREKFIDVSLERDSWLVVSETYMPGWRAFVRPWGGGEDEEFGAGVRLVLANFQGVELPAGDWTIRLVYSPASVQLGMFTSSISVALIVFLLGAWFWRAYIGLNTEASSGLAAGGAQQPRAHHPEPLQSRHRHGLRHRDVPAAAADGRRHLQLRHRALRRLRYIHQFRLGFALDPRGVAAEKNAPVAISTIRLSFV